MLSATRLPQYSGIFLSAYIVRGSSVCKTVAFPWHTGSGTMESSVITAASIAIGYYYTNVTTFKPAGRSGIPLDPITPKAFQLYSASAEGFGNSSVEPLVV